MTRILCRIIVKYYDTVLWWWGVSPPIARVSSQCAMSQSCDVCQVRCIIKQFFTYVIFNL